MKTLNKKAEAGGLQRIGQYVLWIALTIVLTIAIIKLTEFLTTKVG